MRKVLSRLWVRGLSIADGETMIKALGFACIPRLLQEGELTWKTAPGYFFNKLGLLNFLFKCNYEVKYWKTIFFSNVKALYEVNICMRELILYKNGGILIGGKSFLNR